MRESRRPTVNPAEIRVAEFTDADIAARDEGFTYKITSARGKVTYARSLNDANAQTRPKNYSGIEGSGHLVPLPWVPEPKEGAKHEQHSNSEEPPGSG